MSFLNDNQCECGHNKAEHVMDNKMVTRWCSLNQKSCDCWMYKPRFVETRDYALGKIEIIIERDYK